MRSVTCPDCGAQVELPTVSVGDESITVNCQNCLWQDLDSIYKTRRGLEIWSGGGGVAEMACWTCVPPGAGLQAAINSAPGGGILMLQSGVYTGDITIPLNADAIILGSGQDKTVLTGSVTMPGNNSRLENLRILATGKPYGVKLFNSTAGPNRNHFTKVGIGGTVSTADGPTGPGIWLDGAILNVFDHCTIAHCGTDGLYVNTTDPSVGGFSTNVNTFRDCTFNLNSGYGVNIDLGVAGVGGEPTPAVASMQQHMFIGGNMEQNALGAVHVKSAFWTIFEDIDFESDVNLGSSGQIILGENATYLILKNCSIRSGGDTARAFGFNSCLSCRVENCRVAGRFPNIDVGVFDEGCCRCTAQNNAWWDPNSASVNPFNGSTDGVSPRWISNRGQNRGHSA